MREMGAAIGRMHDSDVVHGDLTTSNIMIRNIEGGAAKEGAEQEQGPRASEGFSEEAEFQVVLIDFGLGMTQPSVEDRAVDLYVLERAFLSTHPGSQQLVSQCSSQLGSSLPYTSVCELFHLLVEDI